MNMATDAEARDCAQHAAGGALWGWWSRRQPGNFAATQLEFLPGALEVQDSPPSPLGRVVGAALLSVFVAGLVWAILGHVDIVVSAPGRIVPSGQVKVIQAPEAGIISAIHVKDGDRVEAGEVVLSLDQTFAFADDTKLEGQIRAYSTEIAWRDALQMWLANGASETVDQQLQENLAAGSKALRLFEQRRSEISARLNTLKNEREVVEAEHATVRAEGARIDNALPILEERVNSYKALYEKQFGAKVTYLEMLQQLTEMERSVPVLDAKEQRLGKSLAANDSRYQTELEALRSENLLKITQLQIELDAVQQEKVKSQQRAVLQHIVAPITGTVEQLAVHTVGGVVSPAQKLLKIVPLNAQLQVEVTLQNKDIGFVREGQFAEVKIDTFSFTRYGLVDAKIINVSEDAVAHEQLGWVFPMRLLLQRGSMEIEGKNVRLSPGMSVTVDIRTGQRRLIEFFLSPLLRYRQESVRER